jgi:hypothetical protein
MSAATIFRSKEDTMNRQTAKLNILALAALASLLLGVIQPAAAMPSQTPHTPATPGVVSVIAEGDKLAIYVADAAGANRRRVAQVSMAKAPLLLSDYVALSPDGQSLAYATMDDPFTRANTELWIAATDGSGAQSVAQFPEGFWLAAPVWSPDSQRLAFITERVVADSEQRLELWIMNRDGSGQERLLQGSPLRPALFDASGRVLSWSADGRQLHVNDQTAAAPVGFKVDVASKSVSQEMAEKETDAMAQAAGVATALPCGVQLWHQNDYGDTMRTCNNTIANVGCAITSSAMVLKYFGVNTDPPALNRCMGNCACPICNWGTVASSCSEGKVSWGGAPGFSYSTIDSDLAAGRPVIVYLTRPGNMHFVVVTGGGGQTPGGYSINDPSRYNPLRQTLSPYTNEGWSLSGLRRYSGTPNCSDGDGGDIGYGQSRNGTINPAGDFDDYYFNASSGDVVEIRQSKNGSSLDSYLRLYDQNGNLVAYDDDGLGNYNSFIRRTLDNGGRYRIRAMAYGSSTGAYTLSLTRVSAGGCGGDCEGDNRWISYGQTLNGTISPNSDRDTYYFNGTAGRVVSIRMNRTGGDLDSFVELWSPNGVKIQENDDGGGDRNSWLVHTLPSDGAYRISAYSYRNASSGTYSLRLESVTGGGGSGNLARGKPVWVSSVEFSGVEGWRATDGNVGTRWSSQFSDPQLIYVDLGQSRTFNQVVLKWETAYGRRFGIYYWDGGQWRNVYWTDNGRGGTNTINFGPVTAQFVAMYGVERGTPWGYSLWEFEVYDTTTTTMPSVPPDDPEKGTNTAPLEQPLPPTEGDKGVMLSGDGADGQEETPLAGSDPATLGGQVTGTQTVVASIRTPDADGLYRLYTPAGYVRFEGEASSQGPAGALAITAYSWRSDRSGEIGSQAAFTLPVASLLPGWHTIYFKAQNELGVWSAEASTRVRVDWPYSFYLPAIQK